MRRYVVLILALAITGLGLLPWLPALYVAYTPLRLLISANALALAVVWLLLNRRYPRLFAARRYRVPGRGYVYLPRSRRQLNPWIFVLFFLVLLVLNTISFTQHRQNSGTAAPTATRPSGSYRGELSYTRNGALYSIILDVIKLNASERTLVSIIQGEQTRAVQAQSNAQADSYRFEASPGASIQLTILPIEARARFNVTNIGIVQQGGETIWLRVMKVAG